MVTMTTKLKTFDGACDATFDRPRIRHSIPSSHRFGARTNARTTKPSSEDVISIANAGDMSDVTPASERGCRSATW